MLFGSRRMVVGIAILSIAAACGMTYVLYGTMQYVFRLGLDEQLKSVAAVAALDFDPAELDQIQGKESVGTPTYTDVVGKLQHIRSLVPNMQYAYLLRKTADSNTMDFVADADSLHPDVPEDINHDGKIDASDQKTYPGDPYDVSPFPEFRAAAFLHPFVDPAFTTSEWGVFLSGTSPIQYPADPGRPTNYAIALDLNVTQYQKLLQQVILPFIAFAAFLLVIISLQAFAMRKLWKKQVKQMAELDRQKDELLGIIAHQLFTPITAVKWSTENLLSGDTAGQTHQNARVLLAVQ